MQDLSFFCLFKPEEVQAGVHDVYDQEVIRTLFYYYF